MQGRTSEQKANHEQRHQLHISRHTRLTLVADLTKQADAIKDSINETASAGGAKVVEGALFKATYIESNRSTVDYKKVLAALTALLQEQNKEIDANKIVAGLVASSTNTSAVFSVKVTSK